MYANMENVLNKNHNVTSHQINKVEAQKDSIINDYSKQLRNADRLKNLISEAEKIGIIREDPQKHWNKNKTTCKILIKNSK